MSPPFLPKTVKQQNLSVQYTIKLRTTQFLPPSRVKMENSILFPSYMPRPNMQLYVDTFGSVCQYFVREMLMFYDFVRENQYLFRFSPILPG